MKKLLGFILVATLASCTAEEKPVKKEEKVKEEVLIEVINGVYYEWYPGKKQVKFKGGQDEEKKRNGIWTFYSETGQELSITMYEHGLREGYTIVKYPNGAIHYRGEYRNDKTVGVWTTFDETGKKVSEISYDENGNATPIPLD